MGDVGGGGVRAAAWSGKGGGVERCCCEVSGAGACRWCTSGVSDARRVELAGRGGCGGAAMATGGGAEAGAERRRREMGGVGRNREEKRNLRPAQDTYMTSGPHIFP